MQVKIREHILIHGDLRKTVETQVLGHTIHVEEFGSKEDAEGDDDYVEHQGAFDRRNSFQLIGARLEKRGEQIRLGNQKDTDNEMGDVNQKVNQTLDAVPSTPMSQMGAFGGCPKLVPSLNQNYLHLNRL